ncbi:hypothetical protein Hanom_Chr03g00240081 [Helianthus anomalus]
MVVAVVRATGRSCHEVYERGSTAAAPEGATEAHEKTGGASSSNSWSRDLVTAGEADIVVTTELVISSGLLVITAWFVLLPFSDRLPLGLSS